MSDSCGTNEERRSGMLPEWTKNIPADLTARRQWVVWRLEHREGEEKATKVPYNARTRNRASSMDPRTWSSFAEAISAYGRSESGLDGIGFVFTKEDAFAGVDLDNCIDASGEVAAWAEELIRDLGSYAEVSPSGTGVKVFVKAVLPPKHRKKTGFGPEGTGAVEMYDQGRFFTVTGNRVNGTPETVVDANESVNSIHARVFGSGTGGTTRSGTNKRNAEKGVPRLSLDDLTLLVKATSARNGAEVKALWEGSWESSHGSQSEADLALCSHLAYWTDGDRARMDRMFRQSDLYRLKWDEPHFADGRTYGEATIDQALSGNESRTGRMDGKSASTRPDRPRPLLRTASEILALVLPEPRWAVPGIICEGLNFLAGKPKLGKSWLVLATAIAVASGRRALGSISVDEGDVLYLALEDNDRRLQSRLRTILGNSPAPRRLVLATVWPRADEGGLHELDRWLKDHPQARLVIIDTLACIRPRSTGGGNAYDEDYQVARELKTLADAHEVAFVVVHHVRKMGADDPLDTVSGTAGLTGAADSTLVLQRERGRLDASLFVTGRDVEEQDLPLNFDAATGTWNVLDDAAERRLTEERQQVVRVLREAGRALTPKEAAPLLGKAENATKQMLNRMEKDGQLGKTTGGRYFVPGESGNPGNPGNPVTPVTTVTPNQAEYLELDGLWEDAA